MGDLQVCIIVGRPCGPITDYYHTFRVSDMQRIRLASVFNETKRIIFGIFGMDKREGSAARSSKNTYNSLLVL